MDLSKERLFIPPPVETSCPLSAPAMHQPHRQRNNVPGLAQEQLGRLVTGGTDLHQLGVSLQVMVIITKLARDHQQMLGMV